MLRSFRYSSLLAVMTVFLALTMAACGGSSGNSSNSTTSSGTGGSGGGAGGGGSPSPPPTPSSIDVTTYHYDNLRTGQNLKETTLTTANINQAKFGKLGELMVDGKVDAQPLYLSQVAIPGAGTKNVVYVATEHGSVYAFDADNISGTTAKPLWQISTQLPGEAPSDHRGCSQVTPEIGITSTPVIDRTRGAIYVIAVSKNASGNYFHRLHALDVTSGKELFGGPITITATFAGNGAGGSGGTVTFDPAQYNERAGLLELNGTIFTTWGSHCDIGAYTSWMMAFSADTLKQTTVLDLVPNGNDGGTWMSGAAPAADSAGNIYFIIGNGTFDTTLDANGFPSLGDCGNCYVKVSSTAPPKLLDYFTPQNTVAESNADEDLGAGGPLLLPDVTDATGKTRHLAVGSGKDAIIYVLDRDNMGKFRPTQNAIYQQISGQLAGGEYGKPSYFNGTVYYGAVNDAIKAFPITTGRLASAPSSKTSTIFAYPGATPAISANGSRSGIVWAVGNGSPAILHAYDATNLMNELYNSNQAGGRDQFAGNKFITPVIVNGKVFVGTTSSVAVFGPL